MPSITFTGVDLINYLITDNGSVTQVNGTASQNFTPGSQGNGTLITSGNANTAANFNIASIGAIELTGDFDYNGFPGLPANVVVTGIDVQFEAVLTGTGSGSFDTGGQVIIDGTAAISADGNTGPVPFTSLDMTDSDSASGTTPSVSISASRTLSDHFTDSFSMSRADFVAKYASILIQIFTTGQSSPGSTPGPAQQGSYNTSISFNNFRFTIEYQDLPITMSPTGGSTVESGTRVTLTSDVIHMDTLKPGLVVGDKLIILDPDSQSPTEIVFTVPEPETPECEGCLNDCPECDDCITACEDDFDSPECEECINDCFDCLLECLSFEGLAEECLGAVPETPPGPTPVVVVINDPTGTQFSGSVPLGTLFVILANGSGIYRLVTNQTHDVIYNSSRDGDTYDVKIPNPKFKTGFIRG